MSLCGCSMKPSKEENDKLQVLTTIFPPYDFVREIAGDRVELKMLLPPGNESHNYEPTLKDLSAIQKSDLFFYVGDDSDKWVADLPQDEYGTDMLALNDMVFDNVKEHNGHTHEAEHLWTSVRNAEKMVEDISEALQKADPKNADFYKSNTENYLKKLSELDAEFTAATENAPLKTLVFAERFPFICFAEDYGLGWQAAFDHCSSDFEPKIDVIYNLINIIKTQKIPTIFYIEFSNQSVADTICAATGCNKALFHSCHNVTEQEWKAGETYYSLMSKNLEELRKALRYAS